MGFDCGVRSDPKSVSIIMTHLRLQYSICVHQLVADQAAKSPDAVAVVAGERTLTYRAWEDRANRLAERACAGLVFNPTPSSGFV